jgi:phosphatidylglycerophosphatase C
VVKYTISNMISTEHAPSSSQIAVFDLDGTLLAGDSTVAWIRTLLLSSGPRFLAAVIALPLCLLLIYFRSARAIGASILLWIATFGYDTEALAGSVESFAGNFEAGRTSLRWRKDGLRAMQRHMAAGERVIVVTAAPALLAERLLAPWRRVAVLGSSLGRWQGGWVAARHCRGKEKCRALQDSGYGAVWKYAYTDSDDDAPLLAAAEHAFIVNARPAMISKLEAFGLSRVAQLRWI